MMKLTNFIVVSFVTTDTPYENVIAQYLKPSLDKFNIPYYIEGVENKGSWLKNVAMKPQVIGNAFEKFPGKNIVFVDADAEFLGYPDLFTTIPSEFDMACHFLDWQTWYGHKEPNKELLTGTMFFRNNDQTKKLVVEWYNQADKSILWEQKVLGAYLKTNSTIKIYNLPLEYCYISTLPDGSPPLIKLEQPIIVHHQVSRTLKKRIK